MKTGKDYVTDPNGSSFVVAAIGTENRELLNVMKSLQSPLDIQIDSDSIFITNFGNDCDFYACNSPKNAVDVLLQLIRRYGGNDIYGIFAQDLQTLEDSVLYYDIMIAEAGHSFDAEILCDAYINGISQKTGEDTEMLWQKLMASRGWLKSETTYSFSKKSGDTTVGHYIDGPLGKVKNLLIQKNNMES